MARNINDWHLLAHSVDLFSVYNLSSIPEVSTNEQVKGVQQENSRFVREAGQWFYLDGEVS